MEERRGIHWLAPTTMIGPLLFGIVLAAGHHLFYRHLAGTPPPSDDVQLLGWHVSGQQINIAIGTAMAFLIQSTLVTAVSMAYVQLLWRKFRAQSYMTSDYDVTFGALHSLPALFKFRCWFRKPFLFVHILVAWLIPIASILTPATLSVAFTKISPPPSAMQRVPTLDFTNFNFLASMEKSGSSKDNNSSAVYHLTGPSPNVHKVVTAAAAQGAVLPITAPAPNASYNLHFFGPSLHCRDLENAEKILVRQNIASFTGAKGNDDRNAYLSWAWTTGPDEPIESSLPFAISGTGEKVDHYYPRNDMQYMERIGSFYVAVVPEIWHSDLDWKPSQLAQIVLRSDLTVVQCGLSNHSYQVTFEYTNGDQYVHIGTDDVPDQYINNTVDRQWIQAPTAYTAGRSDCSTFDYPADMQVGKFRPCVFNQAALQSLSYIAVWQAFSSLFLGEIGANSFYWYFNTGIQRTPLVHTRELQFLQTSHIRNNTDMDLQDVIEHSRSDVNTGLYGGHQPPATTSLKDGLEDLFRIVTVSLMSSPLLRSNATSRFAPPLTNVTFHKYENIYVYAAAKLWLAYSIAISVSAIAVSAGLFALFSNGMSFSDTFSTVLRATRHADLSTEVRQQHTDGRDPLPKYLADATITLHCVSKRHKGSVEYVQVTQDYKMSGAGPTIR